MSIPPLNKDQIILNQNETIKLLTRQLQKAQFDLRTLRAALTRQTIQAGKSFQELRGQFDQLAQDLYDIIVHWVTKLQQPLTYDQIISYYRTKYPNSKYTAETITRRIRELAEQDWLHSPIKGTFIPISKEQKEESIH
jgi:hypothetical protein